MLLQRRKLKIGLFGRAKAIALLRLGMTIPGAVKELRQKYHPKHTLTTIKKTYFPASGGFAINKYEGKKREEINELFEKYKKAFEKNLERMTKLNQDPEFKKQIIERMTKLHQDPEFKKQIIERMTKLNQDPKFKKQTRKRMKKLHKDPKFKKQISELMKKLHKDPKFAKRARERASKRMTKLHQDPEFAKRTRERASKLMTKLNQDPEFRRKRLFALNIYFEGIRAGNTIKTKTQLGKSFGLEYDKETGKEKRVLITQPTAEQQLKEQEQRTFIQETLKILPEQQKQFLTEYYGLKENEPLAIEQISIKYNTPKEEIQKQINMALTTLKNNKTIQQLYKELE